MFENHAISRYQGPFLPVLYSVEKSPGNEVAYLQKLEEEGDGLIGPATFLPGFFRAPE